ncbi:mitochondrial import receptor subunit TOM20-like protein [Tanacetum coccineum]
MPLQNLTRWGGALLELSQYGTIDESKKMLLEAVSRLEEALSINPAKHEARWCLGNAYTANAFLISNHDEAKILFDEAFRCFERVVEESPDTPHYLQSLFACSKAPELHKEIRAQVGLQAQQTLSAGPAASSSAKVSAKNKSKSSDLKYDICGWVILAVGIVTWIGMAQSRMPPPPAR